MSFDIASLVVHSKASGEIPDAGRLLLAWIVANERQVGVAITGVGVVVVSRTIGAGFDVVTITRGFKPGRGVRLAQVAEGT